MLQGRFIEKSCIARWGVIDAGCRRRILWIVSHDHIEELGNINNIQWVLPIGAFVLVFMDTPTSRVVLAGEAVFLALTVLR